MSHRCFKIIWQNINWSFRNISNIFFAKLRKLRRLYETGFITGIVFWNNIVRLFLYVSSRNCPQEIEPAVYPQIVLWHTVLSLKVEKAPMFLKVLYSLYWDGKKNNYKGELRKICRMIAKNKKQKKNKPKNQKNQPKQNKQKVKNLSYSQRIYILEYY